MAVKCILPDCVYEYGHGSNPIPKNILHEIYYEAENAQNSKLLS
jgi:hypothetical protein